MRHLFSVLILWEIFASEKEKCSKSAISHRLSFLSVPLVFSQGEDAVPPCDGGPALQGELPEPLAVR